MAVRTSVDGAAIRVDLDAPDDAPSMNEEQIMDFLEAARGGYTGEELNAAFDMVKDAGHWKNPIDAVIPRDQQDVVDKAIAWFTGTEASFYGHDDPEKLIVRAPGYFAGPCN